MKLKVLLTSCVIALAACANIATNGPNATDANILQGAQTAYDIGHGLWDAGKLSDEDAEAIIVAINSVVSYVKASRAASAAGDKNSEAMYLRLAADALDKLTAFLVAKKG